MRKIVRLIQIGVFLLFLSSLKGQEQDSGSKLEKTEESINQRASHLDIVFVLDATGSMGPYITNTRKIITQSMKRFINRNQNVKFGIVAYRDYPPQDNTFITKVNDLGDYETILKDLNELQAQGGGDAPEAVITGVYDAVTKISWRNIVTNNEEKYKKIIFHVGDEPPHGREYNGMYDSFPDGEPGNINLEILAEKLNQEQITYYFCKLTESTKTMEDKFSEKIKIFEVIDISENQVDSEETRKEYEKYRLRVEMDGTADKEEIPSFEAAKMKYGKRGMSSVSYSARVSNIMEEL